MAGRTNKGRGVTIIRRTDGTEGGHHGGAWKVAYADFVTAMMAFFLLMWLLNATTEAQRKGLADYFAPSNALSRNSSGIGLPFGGRTPFASGHELSDLGTQSVVPGKAQEQPDVDDPDADESARAPTRQPNGTDGAADKTGRSEQAGEGHAGGGQATASSLVPARADYLAQAASGSAHTADPHANDPAALAEAALQAELARREEAALRQAAQAVREAVRGDPALADLGRQLSVDLTPEGLRIQIMDAERRPMFATGSADPNEQARLLIGKITPALARLTEPVSIAGHTDAAPYRGDARSNWELSSDRANAARRLLTEDGLDPARVRSVSGEADRDPLLPADPLAAANRRIAILVLRTQKSR